MSKQALPLALATLMASANALFCAEADGFRSLFDGKTLDGWKAADGSFWSVEDGAITAKITPDHPLKANLYLIWQGGELADFELKLKHRVSGSPKINCGFQFRSRELANHDLLGYQVDNNLDTPWLVRLYEEHGRHTLALRGERAAIGEGGKRSAEPLAEAQGLAPFKLEEWHEYDLTCVGNRLTLKVNGRLVAEATDSDPVHFAAQGILALQLHTGPATVAQFKDIRLKILKPAVVRAAAPAEQKPSGDGQPLRDKTLVVWAAPANLTQRGGSALTIDDSQSHFDGLVFAERAPAKWMAGSDHYRRSDLKQDAWPAETADANTFVQMAAVYRGNELTVFRNGKEYERHAVKEPQLFGPESLVLIGPRHLGNGDCFAGAVDDARLYDRALTPGELAALKPNESGGMGDSPMRGDTGKLPAPHIKPWAWWTFDGGACKDRTGRFAAARLTGGAKVENGCLVLDGAKAAFCAARTDEALGGFPGGALPPSLAYKPDLPGDIAVARRFRNHLLADPYRPTYHFVIPEDYAGPFDPNGAIFWRGRYHLFYIYQENRAHCFGHVSSVDMVHWRQHPTPLYPTAESVDRGMFSGNCFVNREGEATMLVHGVGAGNCIFTSTDDNLDRWSRLPSNPIVPTPKGNEPYASWDPHGWVEGDTTYAIFGGTPGSAKPASVFKAKELDSWSYAGPFLHHEMPDVAANEDISCPDFFTLAGKRVLVCIAHNRGARYYVGEWKNEQFAPEAHARLSWSDNLYFAPESVLTPDGRRVLWAWIFDQRSVETKRASGWSGELALPRELTLGEDGLLRFRPLEELKRLRHSEQKVRDLAVGADQEVVLDRIAGKALELEVTFEPGGAKQVGVKVCRSPDREEETLVYYDAAEQKLKIDTGKASLAEGPKSVEAAPYVLKPGEPLALRVFVDQSVVEVFTADGRQALLRRIYPVRVDSVGVSVFAAGGSARLRGASAWRIAPSNPY